jgi:hypothetical protein
MSSQAGNIHDSAAYSGHPSSFIIGSEADPDTLSRQEFAQPTPLPSDMGLRFVAIPVSDDAQYVHWFFLPVRPVQSFVGHLHMPSPLTQLFCCVGFSAELVTNLKFLWNLDYMSLW